MTPEEQRIALAEFDGYTRGKKVDYSFGDSTKTIMRESWIHPNDYPISRLPDYLTDLNAMHEVEKKLTQELRVNYLNNLSKVCKTEKDKVFADASQRAEALLKTIGKWKD